MPHDSHEQNKNTSLDKEQEPQGDPLIDHFMQLPEELEKLQALKADAREVWAEGGFAAPELFIAGDGEPILVGPKDGQSVSTAGDRTYRFLYDGEIKDVVVPRGLQGFAMQTRGSGGYESIFNLHPENDPMSPMAQQEDLAPTEVPPQLASLAAKFGDKLVIEVADSEHRGVRSLVGDVDGKETVIARDIEALANVVRYHRHLRDGPYGAATLSAAQLKELRDTHHAAAHELQDRAELAGQELKIGRFATLTSRGREATKRRVIAAYDEVVYDGMSYEAHKKRAEERREHYLAQLHGK